LFKIITNENQSVSDRIIDVEREKLFILAEQHIWNAHINPDFQQLIVKKHTTTPLWKFKSNIQLTAYEKEQFLMDYIHAEAAVTVSSECSPQN
jgi:hypothetical protein